MFIANLHMEETTQEGLKDLISREEKIQSFVDIGIEVIANVKIVVNIYMKKPQSVSMEIDATRKLSAVISMLIYSETTKALLLF